MKGELPTVEEIEKEIPLELEVIEVNDIDTETLKNAIDNDISPKDIKE